MKKLINPKSAVTRCLTREDVQNMRMMFRKLTMIVMALMGSVAFADITVSDVQVFSGHPWKEVVVGYTITGTSDRAYSIRLRATDHSAKKTYTAQTLKNAELTEGRHVLRWEASAEGVKFSSTNVVFTVSHVCGVQLWGGGPYWSECNIGADKPEDYGYYFWWGDTVGYKRNAADNGWISVKDGSSFSFSSGICPTQGKTISKLQSAGYIDATGNLVAAHDAATAHLGTRWRMPTKAEIDALISNCDTTWTTRNGVWGRLVTGRDAYASRSIFLPAAGVGRNSDLCLPGSYGDYWSSTPNSDTSYSAPHYAWHLHFDSSHFDLRTEYFRADGNSVRPVREFIQ